MTTIYLPQKFNLFDEKTKKSIKIFMESKTLFKVSNIIVPGYPDIIALRTSLLDVLDAKELNIKQNINNTYITHFAQNIELLEDEYFGFLVVWFYLNGIINIDTVMDESYFAEFDIQTMRKWSNYFNIDRKTWFVDFLDNYENRYENTNINTEDNSNNKNDKEFFTKEYITITILISGIIGFVFGRLSK